MNSVSTPLLETIEPDEPEAPPPPPKGNIYSSNSRPTVILTPTEPLASTPGDAESGKYYDLGYSVVI
jgi:hypothetical protein